MTIPGLSRTHLDPTVPRQILESKLKRIDIRLSEIDEYLSQVNTNTASYHGQEIQSERESLVILRAEITEQLNPSAKPARSPELQKLYQDQKQKDIAFLKVAIRHEIQNIEHAALKEEQAGNHRAAKLHRLSSIDAAEEVCRQYGKDPALLAELD
jgi:hypothetical protein